MSPGIELQNNTDQDDNRSIEQASLSSISVGEWSSDESTRETASLKGRDDVGLQIGKGNFIGSLVESEAAISEV